MRLYDGKRLYSATDLVHFLGCAHLTALDIQDLGSPSPRPVVDEATELLQRKGIEHEKRNLEQLRLAHPSLIEIPGSEPLQTRIDLTLAAMRSGAEVIYQGALQADPWHGFTDFLLKVPGNSRFGDWAYDVADTKLATQAKPSHVLQLCVYSDLLARAQGIWPRQLHIVLGSEEITTLRTASVEYYYAIARRRFEGFVGQDQWLTTAEPCAQCLYCRWTPVCTAHWQQIDHLSLVAGITRAQIAKLLEAGISTLKALAQAPTVVPGIGLHPDTLAKLVAQANLQRQKRETGHPIVEILPPVAAKGFNRLPQPDEADLFFDMEGDPYIRDGLEYLFGFIALEAGQELFTDFWAHRREDEKVAFERAIDFIGARLAAHPSAHVYHYAHYEETALKRLAMYHGTRETEVDDLLRQGRLVDLYQVVRESIRTSESGQSIKDMEVFYLPERRSGEVKDAGGSIVAYEKWRVTHQEGLLAEIARYNELDCHSTRLCRDWLLQMRPENAAWRAVGEASPPSEEKLKARQDAEERTQLLAAALVAEAPADDRPWRELLVHLLEFHRREAKPEWWAMFARQEMTDEELLDDPACLAKLEPDPTRPARADKKSAIYSFIFPAQDFKIRLGDEPLRAGSGEPAGEVMLIDEDARRIELKLGPSRSRVEPGASLIPKGPIGDAQLREAIFRYATAVVSGPENRYSSITDILARRPPRLEDGRPGAAIVAEGTDPVEGTIAALRRLDRSYLLIQGPPGTGKTYVSSRAIVALLHGGARIGVASNSHKAINHLLVEVQQAAAEAGVSFRGVKKSSREDQYVVGCPSIINTLDNRVATLGYYQLYAGTAWLFARPELNESLDYLFVDEAGQVSLANLIAMGVSAKNLVLVGDQMQLSQPIQGSHPAGSGGSGLEHLMGQRATVPPDRGVFLGVTRRMHPDVCRFISEAVYDGRLKPTEGTERQRLILPAYIGPYISATGLGFVPVAHRDCTQKSREEADLIAQTYEDLLRCTWIDDLGDEAKLTAAEILVVSPYNMQVDLLRNVLPDGARVGTVDKFQGQEGAVVLISMATSSGEDLPRQIEFLYSRNRLNVAISRARCLAVIFASPRLLEVPCTTIQQMELVNTLCWAKAYADQTAIERSGAHRQ